MNDKECYDLLILSKTRFLIRRLSKGYMHEDFRRYCDICNVINLEGNCPSSFRCYSCRESSLYREITRYA